MDALFRIHGPQTAEVSVLLTDDQTMRELNLRFRGVDEPTDVLSFPAPAGPEMPLGDIAVSVEFAAKGAKARGVSASEEAAFLALHGGLHLLGWDDETDEQRDQMVQEMNRVAQAAGLRKDESWASVPHGAHR